MANQIEFGRTRSTGLVEVLDRVLDKGLFVGGDIKISLAEVELLTIRIHLSPGRSGTGERDRLERRIAALERQLGAAPIETNARPPQARPPKGAPRAKAKGKGNRRS
jgi:hypothetical protein